ncbi:MAG: hypothetical protein HYY18_09015 [Planctomycetes bacterium]|nr:hypothetical protein [Planctomycetota bacterium]
MKLALSLALVASAAGTALAQSEDPKKEIDDLKKRVNELELRLGSGAAKPGETPPKPDASPTWKDLVSLGGHLKWYGFLRLDSTWSDSRFDDPRAPFWVLSEDDDTFIAGATHIEKNDDNFNMHPKISRLGFELDSGAIAELADARASGKLEFDFLNVGTESHQAVRLRHAYGKVGWESFYLLFGQTADLVSPLLPTANNATQMGYVGNIGYRRPQIRLAFEPKFGERVKLLVAVAAAQEGAVRTTNIDLDGLGVRDGDDPGWPELQARVGITAQHWVEKKWITLAGWAMYGAEETDLEVDGKTHFDTYVYGFDFEFPILSQITFLAEYWEGLNLADMRGGIAQGINAASGQEIRARGGWAEIKVAPVKWYAATLGGGFDDPHDHEFGPGMRTKNSVWWVDQAFVFSPFVLRLEYSHWRTEYEDLEPGRSNRYTLILQLNF